MFDDNNNDMFDREAFIFVASYMIIVIGSSLIIYWIFN